MRIEYTIMHDGTQLAVWDSCTNWSMNLGDIVMVNNSLWRIIGGLNGTIEVWPYDKEEIY